MDKPTTPLAIPTELYSRIEEKIKAGQFSGSVDDYVIKILEEQLSSDQTADELSREDEEKIKERLKALGYMD